MRTNIIFKVIKNTWFGLFLKLIPIAIQLELVINMDKWYGQWWYYYVIIGLTVLIALLILINDVYDIISDSSRSNDYAVIKDKITKIEKQLTNNKNTK